MARYFRVFDGGQNNCYFDSAVKNTNMPQNKILQHRLVLTGTIVMNESANYVLPLITE